MCRLSLPLADLLLRRRLSSSAVPPKKQKADSGYAHFARVKTTVWVLVTLPTTAASIKGNKVIHTRVEQKVLTEMRHSKYFRQEVAGCALLVHWLGTLDAIYEAKMNCLE